MRGPLLIATAALCTAPLAAEEAPDENSAVIAVKTFMTAFDAQNADAMSASLVDGATVAVIEEREGDDRARIVPLSALVQAIASNPADLAEPVWGFDVISKPPVATVTASYEFLIDGKRSHCGTNIFSLVRVDGDWKIASIVYSQVEDNCPERLAP